MINQVAFIDWGLVPYKEAWDKQEELFNSKVQLKFQNRLTNSQPQLPVHHLIFCEHPHVFTLGKSGKASNLLVTPEKLIELEATYQAINRGGDITYHGPGQLVGYPIIDLEQFFTDIHKYLRLLEEAVILTLAQYGLQGERYDGFTGVWLDVNDPEKARKICAMGVRCSRWITMHGFAFNINTNLDYFNYIIPCGIDDKKVTSLQQELGHPVSIEEVKSKLKLNLAKVFPFQLV